MAMEEYSLQNIKIDMKNNRVFDITTGEIFKDKADIRKILDKASDDKKEDNAKTKQIRKMFDMQEKKDIYHLDFKKNSHFIKIYRTELREYMQTIKLSPNAGLFLICLQSYVEYQTNRIAKPNGESFNNDELQEITGLSDKTLKNTLNELEQKLFIKRVGQRQAREIYFNPYLICAGNEIEKNTLNLFHKYEPITSY